MAGAYVMGGTCMGCRRCLVKSFKGATVHGLHHLKCLGHPCSVDAGVVCPTPVQHKLHDPCIKEWKGLTGW